MPTTAVLQEWIAAHGGSENVAEVMARTLDADVYTLWREDTARFGDLNVHESWLARSPLKGRRAAALPLMSTVWRGMDLSSYDRVVISSHAFAHHAGSSSHVRDAEVFVYAHTPARYLWAPDLDDRGSSALARAAAAPLRRLDRARVPRRASIAANSEFVRKRVHDAWGVDARVIPPPVDVARIQAGMPWADRLGTSDEAVVDTLPDKFVLGASRFVSYKRLDAAIRVGEALGLPVVLAGRGPEKARLAHLADSARVPVSLIEAPSTPLLCALYEAASLFVFAAVEDFGIMPVEAMATGTPVLANSVGGAAETVSHTGGGAVTDFRDGLAAAAGAAMAVAPERVRSAATRFDTAVFAAQVKGWVGAS